MVTSAHDYRRPILVQAVKELVREATLRRAVLPLAAPEREFYLGVEAAAEEVLHPQLASARPKGWPDREAPAFREGYLEATAMLASAMTAPEVPPRLPLPEAP